MADLNERTRDILERRFGLKDKQRETLETIGKNYGITRERVRQIETDGLFRLKAKSQKSLQKTCQYFEEFLRESGDLRKETILFDLTAPSDFSNHISFLLSLAENFKRYSEDESFHTLWTINPQAVSAAKDINEFLVKRFEQANTLLSLENLFSVCEKEMAETRILTPKVLLSYLEISKSINLAPAFVSKSQKSDSRSLFFGLKDWPEIRPRGVKDRAYLVLNSEKQPLHFTKIASLINQLSALKNVQARTVHNELIKDQRFVLIGRGIYGLKDWGYQPGYVKDVIFNVLKQAAKPLSKEEILETVLKQRMVKANTVLLNLNNSQCFVRDEDGRYRIA